jgi:hypothetical protein
VYTLCMDVKRTPSPIAPAALAEVPHAAPNDDGGKVSAILTEGATILYNPPIVITYGSSGRTAFTVSSVSIVLSVKASSPWWPADAEHREYLCNPS